MSRPQMNGVMGATTKGSRGASSGTPHKRIHHLKKAPATSFWSRFFCRGAELMTLVPSSPSSDADALSDSEAPVKGPSPSAGLGGPAPVSRSAPPPLITDSSDEDEHEVHAAPLSGTATHAMELSASTLAARTSFRSSPTQPSPRSTMPVVQKTMSREHLYDSIRRVRVARSQRRGGGCGSFSPQKVMTAVKTDQRVLRVPGLARGSTVGPSMPPSAGTAGGDRSNPLADPGDVDTTHAMDEASTRTEGDAAADATRARSSLGSASVASSPARQQPTAVFQVKDTRFFPTPEALTPGESDGPVAADSDETRHLAQVLTEKRLQQHHQKLVADKRQREALAAQRELEREQRELAAQASATSARTDANGVSMPPATAAVLTVELLEAHKRGAALNTALVSSSEETRGDEAYPTIPRGPTPPLLELPSPTGRAGQSPLSARSSQSNSSAFEDDKMPGVMRPLASSAMPATGLVCIPDPAREDVTQCAMPRTGAGVARLVRAMHRASTTDAASPTAAQCGARTVSKYPLHSRAYIERVVLADHRQQALALLFLLDETHRFAWEWHLKLLQFYHYYFHRILLAVPDPAMRAVLETALLTCGTGSVAAVHHQFYRDGQPVDYQQYTYEFEEDWRKLFLSVRGYLDMPYRGKLDSVSVADGDAASSRSSSTESSAGTVGFAATLLHSMELFQRQQEVQNAAQESSNWTIWFYYVFLPAVQSGRAPPMPASVVSLDAKAETSVDSSTTVQGTTSASTTPPPPDVLPMKWVDAQDATLRSNIYLARRQSKLDIIRRAEKALRQRQRERQAATNASKKVAKDDSDDTDSSSRSCDSSGASSTVSSSDSSSKDSDTAHPSPTELHGGQPLAIGATSAADLSPRGDETLQLRVLPPSAIHAEARLDPAGTAEEPVRTTPQSPTGRTALGEEVLEDYRVVNVGCFGFSFWSRADW